MTDLDVLAAAVAAVAAFALSGAWYAFVPAEPLSAGGATPPPERPAPLLFSAELGRSAVVALVVAGLAAEIGVDQPGDGVLLGLALFAGFPAVLFAGSILHEGYPARLAAVHLGDWLLKLLAIGAVVGAFG